MPCEQANPSSLDSYIPLDRWGKDHWSTLAYVENVMTECKSFQVGADGRMRSNRRNFRVMAQYCPAPKRPTRTAPGIPMQDVHGTVLNTGTQVPNHDDWCCVQDMAAEGLFTVGPEGVEPGELLHFSDKGYALVHALRRHKAEGGSFSTFKPS